MQRFLLRAALLCAGLGLFSAAHAENRQKQRLLFEEAHRAIQDRQPAVYQPLLAQLADYPLLPYLRYAYLKANLEQADKQEILDFLNAYPDSPASDALRLAWLRKLGKAGDWRTFLQAYTPREDATLQCYAVQARIHAKQAADGLLADAKALWLSGDSLPDACDPVFAYLEQKGGLTPDLRWERARLALRKGNFGLARVLAKKLPPERQAWIERWQAAQNGPAKVLQDFAHPDGGEARDLLVFALKRLARQDARGAHAHWRQYRGRYALDAQDDAELSRHIALWAADQELAEWARQWLAEVDATRTDYQVRHTRLELLLRAQDWPAVLALLKEVPDGEDNPGMWRYWRARALEQTGQAEEAAKLFQALAEERGFHSFLAAERLGRPYRLNPRPLDVPQALQDKLLARPDMQRAQELYFVGWLGFARQEWQRMLNALPPEDIAGAAWLAAQWGWHDRAIVAATKGKLDDALEVRFPTAFYDAVMKEAHAQDLNYAWVYAIIRQESAFQTDALSGSGALGLMQLLPATARDTAKRADIPLKDDAAILDPVTNIRLGAAYLQHLLARFDNNHLLATAAYNAGPGRAKRWAEAFACLPQDIWVEIIPFRETREYVQRVMSYTPVFEFRLLDHAAPAPMPLDAVGGAACAAPPA